MKRWQPLAFSLAWLAACSSAWPVSAPGNVEVDTLAPGTKMASTVIAATGTPPVLGPTSTSSQGPRTVHLGTSWADFSLKFDSTQWQVVPFDKGLPGMEALVYRSMAGCQITPNVPVGIGEDWTIEDKETMLGKLTLTSRSFLQQGQLKFVVYYGFLGNLHDGAVEVHFLERSGSCIQAAEELIASADVILPRTPSVIAPTPAAQPTPTDVIGGGMVVEGPMTFDLRLFRDPSFNQHPVASSLYSDLNGIGCYLQWSYTGPESRGPVSVYWGTLPHLSQLIQDIPISLSPGSHGGRTGGVLLPGGFFIAGESKEGDHVSVAIEVITPEKWYGAVLNFTLQEGTSGFEPANIWIEVLSKDGV